MSLSPILIIGGTGHLGMRILRQLSAAGVTARALVRSRDKANSIAALAAPVLGDLLVPGTLAEAFRGVERVFIVAPPTPDMEVLERHAIDGAVAAGAKRIVYLSNFAAAEGHPMRPMHIHGRHERVVASLGLEWTVLGPTRYMTNFPFDWPAVLNHGVLHESGGTGTMTCIDPDDVAEIAVKALTEERHVGQTYRLTSDDSFTAAELALLLSRVVGRTVTVAAGDGQVPGGYFGLVAAGQYKKTDTAAALLGRRPRAYADWLEQNLPAQGRA